MAQQKVAKKLPKRTGKRKDRHAASVARGKINKEKRVAAQKLREKKNIEELARHYHARQNMPLFERPSKTLRRISRIGLGQSFDSWRARYYKEKRI